MSHALSDVPAASDMSDRSGASAVSAAGLGAGLDATLSTGLEVTPVGGRTAGALRDAGGPAAGKDADAIHGTANAAVRPRRAGGDAPLLALAAGARRAWRAVVERSWRQVPVSIARRLMQPLPDRAYLTLGHLFYFGRWPNYRNPATFNEHIQEYMLRCRDPLLRVAADKVDCRDYIAATVGAQHVVPLLGVWDDADAVPLETLPRPCVLKPSAASGWVILLKEGDPRAPAELRAEMRKWLRRDYSRLHREWCYRGLPRRIIAEPMLLDETGENPPTDYKAYVIGGKCRYFHVDRDRFTHHTRNLYGPDWTLLPLRWSLENHPPEPPPGPLAQMVQMAEDLARPFEFVRVDFYVVRNHVYVGELTNYPGAGFEKFIPGHYAKIVGGWWKRRD